VQVNVSGSGPSITFNVTTTAPHQARLDAPSLGTSSKITLVGLFVLLLLPIVRRRRKFSLWFLGLLLILGFGACAEPEDAVAVAAPIPGPGWAKYSFTATATTGSGASQFTTTVQVPVLVN
jgi:hypothetical protein